MGKKAFAVLLLASLLLLSLPRFASATPPVGQWWGHVLDSPEVYGGYVDLKDIYAACDGTHLLLLAEFYDSIPNDHGCRYSVYFYLDTDRNPATGDSMYGILGAEFEVRARSYGDAPRDGRLQRWNPVTSRWVELPDPVEVVFEAGGDYVGAAVSLDALDLAVGDTFNFIIKAEGSGWDPLTNPFTYAMGEDVFITVDGSGGDWPAGKKRFSDPAGDFPRSEFDFTDLYVTDCGGRLYFRGDFSAPPPVTTLPKGSYLYCCLDLYIDTDRDPATGSRYDYGGDILLGGIGAEHSVYILGVIDLDGKRCYITVEQWTGTEWAYVPPFTWHEAAWETVLEGSIAHEDLDVGPAAIVDIYLAWAGGGLVKRAPVTAPASYTIVVDETAPSISGVDYSPESPTSDEAVTVTATVTDAQSGVETVEILYSTDGGAWISSPMTGGSPYTGTIPKQAGGTTITFKVKATDYMGNTAESATHTYQVKKVTILGLEPILFYTLIGGLTAGVAAVVALVFLRRKPPAPPPYAPPPTAPAYCPGCGATLRPEAEFCPNCGRRVR